MFYYKNPSVFPVTVLIVHETSHYYIEQVLAPGSFHAYPEPVLDRYVPHVVQRVNQAGYPIHLAQEDLEAPAAVVEPVVVPDAAAVAPAVTEKAMDEAVEESICEPVVEEAQPATLDTSEAVEAVEEAPKATAEAPKVQKAPRTKKGK